MRAQFFFRTMCERWRPGEKERGQGRGVRLQWQEGHLNVLNVGAS